MSYAIVHQENPNRSKNIAALTIGTAGVLAGLSLPVMKWMGVEVSSWRVVALSAAAISTTSIMATKFWLDNHSHRANSWDEIQEEIAEVAPDLKREDRPESASELDQYMLKVSEEALTTLKQWLGNWENGDHGKKWARLERVKFNLMMLRVDWEVSSQPTTTSD